MTFAKVSIIMVVVMVIFNVVILAWVFGGKIIFYTDYQEDDPTVGVDYWIIGQLFHFRQQSTDGVKILQINIGVHICISRNVITMHDVLTWNDCDISLSLLHQ